ncbi:hypothetical protein [Rhizobium sp. BK251]|uniref:hypothetical protein n=1 Tax=Rhizobium sp. BK251 TaxID=2512125 RepID=UPI00104A7DD5|nr:hypothetical protein [Rhizobium sp. BK251]
MMASHTPPSSTYEEAPLISNRFIVRATIAVAVLAAVTIGVNLAGRWIGQRLELAGHTTSTETVAVAIGEDALRLPENTIRFANQRRNGPAERLDLYLAWPRMQGYSEDDRSLFSDISQSSGLIFLQVTESVMSRDMSGRLEPIYSHLIEGPAGNAGHGLTLHRLRADAGYGGEVLLTAARPGMEQYVVRCILPSAPDKATSGDCQRDIGVGKDLSVLYRFSSAHLADWDHIDAAIMTFVTDHLVVRAAASNAETTGDTASNAAK